jgi:hypothetical protein
MDDGCGPHLLAVCCSVRLPLPLLQAGLAAPDAAPSCCREAPEALVSARCCSAYCRLVLLLSLRARNNGHVSS